MSNFNPFAVGTPEATPIVPSPADPSTAAAAALSAVIPPPAPAAQSDGVVVEEALVSVDGNGEKTKKPRKTREKKNTIITKEQKQQILKRYATESCTTIGIAMNLEARQVYNVVRNSRIKMEEALNTETDPNKRTALEAAIAKLPHKEFGGGAATGPRANTLTEDDIIATLLG